MSATYKEVGYRGNQGDQRMIENPENQNIYFLIIEEREILYVFTCEEKGSSSAVDAEKKDDVRFLKKESKI